MYCNNCGHKLCEGSRFCVNCGGIVENSSIINVKHKSDSSGIVAKKQIKSVLLIIGLIVFLLTIIGVVIVAIIVPIILEQQDENYAKDVAYDIINEKYNCTSLEETTQISDTEYQFVFSVDENGEIWSCKGNVTVNAVESDSDWEATITNSSVSYIFHDNNYFYKVAPYFGGNYAQIFQYEKINQYQLCITYCSHDLGNWGSDEYDYGAYVEDIVYNEKLNCFELDYLGNWRFYSDRIEYIHYESQRYTYEKYSKILPVDPNDTWWYDQRRMDSAVYLAIENGYYQ